MSPPPPGPDLQLSREEEVDLTLLRNEVGVESALLYAKAWSKHIKDLLVWMEKRASMGEEDSWNSRNGAGLLSS